jgi:hypothetical protein
MVVTREDYAPMIIGLVDKVTKYVPSSNIVSLVKIGIMEIPWIIVANPDARFITQDRDDELKSCSSQ